MPEKYWVISRRKASSEKNPSTTLVVSAAAAKNEQLGIVFLCPCATLAAAAF